MLLCLRHPVVYPSVLFRRLHCGLPIHALCLAAISLMTVDLGAECGAELVIAGVGCVERLVEAALGKVVTVTFLVAHDRA